MLQIAPCHVQPEGIRTNDARYASAAHLLSKSTYFLKDDGRNGELSIKTL